MKLQTIAIACLSCLSFACSGGTAEADSNATFPLEPLLLLHSESAALDVELRTLPSQPPVIGASSVQMVIRDAASGAPLSGLDLEVVPWMPAMGHGSAVRPTSSEPEPGTYEVTGVVMFMPGTWQLRTTVDGSITDHVVPTFQVR